MPKTIHCNVLPLPEEGAGKLVICGNCLSHWETEVGDPCFSKPPPMGESPVLCLGGRNHRVHVLCPYCQASTAFIANFPNVEEQP